MKISWWTLGIQAANFLVLVWLLQRFLYKPVKEIIRKRGQLAERSVTEAQQAREAAEQQRRLLARSEAEIEDKRLKVVDEARASVEAERAHILEDARKQAVEQINNAKEAIAQQKVTALRQLRQEIADLAIEMARILLTKVAPLVPREASLDQLVLELEHMAQSERERLGIEIAANNSTLRVVTARPLTLEEEQQWRLRLEQVLNHRLDLRFEQDPALLSGAVLHLPQTIVAATWADQLAQAKAVLLKGTDDIAS